MWTVRVESSIGYEEDCNTGARVRLIAIPPLLMMVVRCIVS